MKFKQWQNYVTRFSRHSPVIMWCMTVIHYVSMGMLGFITGKSVNVMKMRENVLHRIAQVQIVSLMLKPNLHLRPNWTAVSAFPKNIILIN